MAKFKIIRKVTMQECDWLSCDIEKGEIVFEYTGHTYGCISSEGTACTYREVAEPFFEIPNDALEEIKEGKP